MTDLRSILPDYNPPNRRLLTLFEAHNLTTTDLLTLDASDIARRITTPRSPAPPPNDIAAFTSHLSTALVADSPPFSAPQLREQQRYLTVGDARIDALLGGGVAVGGITEFVGESGAGKTQFLLTLSLTSQLPPSMGGLSRPALYISTESPLPTPRLLQLARSLNTRLRPPTPVSTDRVLAISCTDLETQDHILRYQLPVAVARHNVGLVIIDSIAANFRAELDRPSKRLKMESGPAMLARRGGELTELARGLREVARRYGVAVVVANQVSDRFFRGGWEREAGGEEEVWGLDYQSRWFTGWEGREGGKVPALGLVWANQIAARVVVRKAEETGGRRKVGVVFSAWAKAGREVGFEVWEGGVRAVGEEEEEEEGGGSGGGGGQSIYG